MDSLKLKNLALFAGGVLFGTAGVKILSSKDVKKVYVEGTAAVLRARDCVMGNEFPANTRTSRQKPLNDLSKTVHK